MFHDIDLRLSLSYLYDTVTRKATTGDTWNSIIVDISKYRHTTVLVGNTGSNSIDIAVYVANSELQYSVLGNLTTPTTLSAGQVERVVLNERYLKLIVYYKNYTAGESSEITIDIVGSFL